MVKNIRLKNKAHDVSKYLFTHGEPVLFDANIWLYLYPAPSNPKRPEFYLYSPALSNMLMSSSKPVVDPIILSEYLNRYCRIEYEGNYRQKYSDYKTWRKSKDFVNVSLSAKTFALSIIDISNMNMLNSDSLDMKNVVGEFASGDVDFNDAVYIEICRRTGIKLMTHDADFKYGGIEILTANKKLLRACP